MLGLSKLVNAEVIFESFLRRIRLLRPPFIAAVAIAISLLFTLPSVAARYDGKLTLTTVDQQTGQRIPVRMELRDARGRAVRVKSEGVVSQGDYFVFDGEVTLELRKGSYQFLIEAGPEYQTRPGHFTIERHAEDETEVVLRRQVDMQAEGWWAGDLDVWQRGEGLPLLMRAAGIDFASALEKENLRGKCRKQRASKNTALGPHALLDFRRGGGLLMFHWGDSVEALDICRWKSKDSSLLSLDVADQANAEIVALTPFAWDLPLWVAAGKLDAIQIIHRLDSEGQGKPRDKVFYPGKQGNGRWSEAIYHHLLNCGLRIAPAAGSGSGSNGNPVGMNRVYVYCEDNFTPEKWFEGLRAGRVTVTNGPLLRAQVEGQLPGHTFKLETGESRDFQIALSLTFYEKAPVEYLEIIKNGQVVYEVRLDQLAQQQGRLPPIEFEESGWFLIRARTSKSTTYQFATTGPYFVDSNYQRRISRKSVQFFLDWLDEAAEEFSENEAVLADIESARPFWKNLLQQANAE